MSKLCLQMCITLFCGVLSDFRAVHSKLVSECVRVHVCRFVCVRLCVFVENGVVQQQLEESQKDQTAEENGAASHFFLSHKERERDGGR